MPHWTLDDIPWQDFDPSKVDPALVKLMKAASLVEFNARDYVRYLREVFKDDPEFQQLAQAWGDEEVQHGAALRRWAELADPTFNFDVSFRRFTTGYQQLPGVVNGSVRGSRSGELIARCIVEMGTSNYYTAIKEYSAEPVLKAVASRIAADEFRHYKLFYDALARYRSRENPGLWKRLRVAFGRVAETEDDELAYAYYAANTAAAEPYDRARYTRMYAKLAYALYERRHVDNMAAMLFKAVGLKPHTRFFRALTALAWMLVRLRTRMLKASAGAPFAAMAAAPA